MLDNGVNGKIVLEGKFEVPSECNVVLAIQIQAVSN
jgi:hypothetical protein